MYETYNIRCSIGFSELAQSSERLQVCPDSAVLALVMLFPAYPDNLSLNSCKQYNSHAFIPNPTVHYTRVVAWRHYDTQVII